MLNHNTWTLWNNCGQILNDNTCNIWNDGMNDVKTMIERCWANPQIILNDDRTIVGNSLVTIHGLYRIIVSNMLVR